MEKSTFIKFFIKFLQKIQKIIFVILFFSTLGFSKIFSSLIKEEIKRGSTDEYAQKFQDEDKYKKSYNNFFIEALEVLKNSFYKKKQKFYNAMDFAGLYIILNENFLNFFKKILHEKQYKSIDKILHKKQYERINEIKSKTFVEFFSATILFIGLSYKFKYFRNLWLVPLKYLTIYPVQAIINLCNKLTWKFISMLFFGVTFYSIYEKSKEISNDINNNDISKKIESAAVKNDMFTLKEKLKTLKNQKKILEEEVKFLKINFIINDELKKEKLDANVELQKALIQVENFENAYSKLLMEKKALEEENNKYRLKDNESEILLIELLDAKAEENLLLKNKIKNLKTSVCFLRGEIQNLKNSLDAKVRQKAKELNSELEFKIKETQNNYDDLLIKFEALKEKYEKYLDENAKHKIKIKDLMQKNAIKIEKINNLQETLQAMNKNKNKQQILDNLDSSFLHQEVDDDENLSQYSQESTASKTAAYNNSQEINFYSQSINFENQLHYNNLLQENQVLKDSIKQLEKQLSKKNHERTKELLKEAKVAEVKIIKLKAQNDQLRNALRGLEEKSKKDDANSVDSSNTKKKQIKFFKR